MLQLRLSLSLCPAGCGGGSAFKNRKQNKTNCCILVCSLLQEVSNQKFHTDGKYNDTIMHTIVMVDQSEIVFALPPVSQKCWAGTECLFLGSRFSKGLHADKWTPTSLQALIIDKADLLKQWGLCLYIYIYIYLFPLNNTSFTVQHLSKATKCLLTVNGSDDSMEVRYIYLSPINHTCSAWQNDSLNKYPSSAVNTNVTASEILWHSSSKRLMCVIDHLTLGHQVLLNQVTLKKLGMWWQEARILSNCNHHKEKQDL